jgi:hypothetical protein
LDPESKSIGAGGESDIASLRIPPPNLEEARGLILLL